MHEVDSEFTHKIERTFGKVERTLRLPKDADGTKAIAKFEGGVLLVTFPKIPGIESGAKRITIT
jgi:HSP20 family molecular chaperone IbpA